MTDSGSSTFRKDNMVTWEEMKQNETEHPIQFGVGEKEKEKEKGVPEGGRKKTGADGGVPTERRRGPTSTSGATRP